jgi:hypothetical protein
MWPDRYSDRRASVIRRQWNSEAVTFPRAGTAAEPDTLQIIGGFAATESLFFASSETGLVTVLLLTDSSLRFSLSRD